MTTQTELDELSAVPLEEWRQMCLEYLRSSESELVKRVHEKLLEYGERGRDILRIMVASWPEVASPYAHRLAVAESVLWEV